MLIEMRLGQNTKQRGLAHLGQANDSSFHKEAAFSRQLSVVSAE
jgi:hypothetical protein